MPAGARFGPITPPLAQPLSEIRILGRVYTIVIRGHRLTVWLAVSLTAFVLTRVRFGLWLQAVGEGPEAVGARRAIGVPGVCLSMA